MSLTGDDVFAGYTIQRLLGSGGMGEVYLALHPRLPRPYALKVLAPELTDDAEFRERFNADAEIAATLSHPHIVGVHDRGEDGGRLWIAMEYVDGIDASRLIRDRFGAEMPIGDVVAVIIAVADALDYAHERGLMHGDVKPAKILLSEFDSPRRRILLTELGIPRRTGQPDQYALAATAFHLLTGSPPQQGAPAGRLSEFRPELARVDPVMSAALAADPAQRYPRCLDFAHALRRAVAGEPETGTVSAQVQMPINALVPPPFQPPAGPPPLLLAPGWEPPARRPRSRWLIPLILAILLAGVSAFAATQFLRPTPKPSPVAAEWQPYVDAARTFSGYLFNIGADSSEVDVQRILDGSTGSFHDDFVKQRENFIQVLKATKSTTKATAKGAGLESIDESTAHVLVVEEAQVTNSGGAQPPRIFRLKLDVVRIEGAYKISKLEFAR
ncbi:MAG: serine/threonine protein kinase, bacterial [Mycobacterium sp.]|jgi:serine/threonine-protein kinase|nr:serine/threonine protein kinase, bacterial [Mycobacterium sp.]